MSPTLKAGRRLISLLVFIFVLLAPIFSYATATRFSVFRAYPSALHNDFQFIYGSQGLFHLEWEAGTQLDIAYRPMEGSTRTIIDTVFTEHFFAGIGLFDWFSLGADLPIAWFNRFQQPSGTGGFENALDMGDLRIDLKFEILSPYRYPVGIAVVPFIHLPTGNAQNFVGDESILGGGILALDVEFARRFVLGLNTGVEVGEDINVSNIQISKARLLLGLGAAVKFTPKLDFTLEGIAKGPLDRLFEEVAENPVELLGGLRWKAENGLSLSGGFGAGLVYGAGAPRIRGLLKASYAGSTEAHKRKRQKMMEQKYGLPEQPAVEWAVFELKGKCPEKPEDFNPEIHDPSCPKYYELSQIASLSLSCPSQEEDFDPEKHDPACPKVYELRKDLSKEEYATVYVLAASDLANRCPEDPSQFNPEIHDQDCPKFFELRETVSLVSRCPATEEDFNPEIHDAGCPKVYSLSQDYEKSDIQAIYLLADADSDRDGIRDLEDRCPQSIGVAAFFGCPEVKIEFKEGQIIGTEIPITFAFGRSELSGEMARAFNEVAELLLNHPEIRKVRIEGHADSVGTDAMNRYISKRRADLVKDYLVSCGVESERIHTVGMGEEKPVAPNTTAEGRAQNRRATLLVIELIQQMPANVPVPSEVSTPPSPVQ
ncbi:MAG: OmpA family protein [Deltaproteobacteria bacterium]|nr:OmpA family protein [Deltaproteobacteria bacterium]